LLTVASVTLYIGHAPSQPPNGGTWLGYILGIIGAVLIVFLAWFGVRKRQYHRTDGRLSGWASAHIYLGTALIVIVSLHCGFQFGWNVHTLAYSLMVIVVSSGFCGLYAYLVLPDRITANRSNRSRTQLITQIAGLDEDGLELAEQLGERVHHLMLLAIERTCFGGSLWQQLTGGGLFHWKGQWMGFSAPEACTNAGSTGGACLEMPHAFADREAEAHLMRVVGETHSAERILGAADLLDILHQRQTLIRCLRRDERYHALMKSWLCIHIPFSIALLAAVVVHVVVVFFYW
jgi:hypothetical protein